MSLNNSRIKNFKSKKMKNSILNLGKILHKAEQKTINGGDPLFQCQYYCSGTTRLLKAGNGKQQYLHCPAISHNHPDCGGTGGGIEIWA